jgi:hypothetical protein
MQMGVIVRRGSWTRGKILIVVVAVAWGHGYSTCAWPTPPPSSSDYTRALLRNRLIAIGAPPHCIVAAERLHAVALLTHFYQRQAYQLAWTHDGTLSPLLDDLLTAIRNADHDGLQ